MVNDEPFLQASWGRVQSTLNINVMGTSWTIKLLAEHRVYTKTGGSIVAISSINGRGMHAPVKPKSAYNASEAVIKGLMGPLAGELGQYEIRVNCISPRSV